MVGGSLPLEPQIIGRICGSAERMPCEGIKLGEGEGSPGCRIPSSRILCIGDVVTILIHPLLDRVLEQFTCARCIGPRSACNRAANYRFENPRSFTLIGLLCILPFNACLLVVKDEGGNKKRKKSFGNLEVRTLKEFYEDRSKRK